MACTASCQPGEFLCREGKCIPELHICDGTADCGQGDDEVSDHVVSNIVHNKQLFRPIVSVVLMRRSVHMEVVVS